MIDTNKFRFVVLNARDRSPETQPLIQSAYEMWRKVWTEALLELDGSDRLPSDDFSRHEQVGALFYDGQAIGSCFFSQVDLAQPIWRKDSYFEVWPEELLVQLGEQYPDWNVLICCYFTLSAEWRRSIAGFSAKQLLAALAVEHFKHTPCGAMVGTMRVNRGMHTLCYDLGAQPLMQGVKQHGVDVDLIVFDQDHLKELGFIAPMSKEARAIYANSMNAGEREIARKHLRLVKKAG